jgi:hypothetical protein
MPSILFFLGILMTVAALESLGLIFSFGQDVQSQMDNNTFVMLLGAGSAVIDNVPLVAASMGMFDMNAVDAAGNLLYDTDASIWHFIAYAAGTGGSMLIIGSAAGVVAMGMEKITFGWYLKKILWIALVGYFAGIAVFLLMRNLISSLNSDSLLDWMFAKLPMYQNIGASAYKEDISNIISICDHLDNPQNKFKSIHVGGTNGKGSTSHMLSSILQESGYKVGLYTSPHLVDFRERIRVNGKMISKESIEDFMNQNLNFFDRNNFSFFEMTVGLAFDYFNNQNVEIAIIEVGMGGRLDSTNIINPILSIITNISIDHAKFLGNNITDIAYEKAGIIKPGIPVIIGETQEEIKDIFIENALENNSEISFDSPFKSQSYSFVLKLSANEISELFSRAFSINISFISS